MLVSLATAPGDSAKARLARRIRTLRLVRHAVMLFFFVFLLHVAWEHQSKGGGPRGAPSVEAYCPFGGVESLYQFLTTGGFVRRIEPSAMILLVAVVLLTLLFSRGFCGWICPFGSLQEWLGKLGRKIFGSAFNRTGPLEKGLRSLKYVVLALIIGFTWRLGVLVFREYDPFLAFFHLGRNVGEMPYAYAALAVVVLGSLRYERFFCRYACPLGAVIGILGKIGLTKIARSDEGCKGCNLCQKSCWAGVDITGRSTVNDIECNHCLECVAHCPKPEVLRLRGLRMSFSPGVYGAALVAGLMLFIGVSRLSGYWRTKPATVSLLNAKGQPDPGQIRGWMTLDEVGRGYGLPLDELRRAAGLPASVPGDVALNRIAERFRVDFEPEQLRETVAALLESRKRPGSVAPAKADGPALAPANSARPAPGGARPGAQPAREPAHAEEAASPSGPGANRDEPSVRGVMTLNEISLKAGVPADCILDRLGISGVNPRVPVREWIHEFGKTIQDVRGAASACRGPAQ